MLEDLTLSDVFPTAYLKASDVGDAGLLLTIKNFTLVTFRGGDKADKKLVLEFVELKKVLVVNKTNSRVLARLYGEKLRNWIGKAIELYTEPVTFQGQLMVGVRVRPRVPISENHIQV